MSSRNFSILFNSYLSFSVLVGVNITLYIRKYLHTYILYTDTDIYRESPHKTVKCETENTVLCEIVLFQIENRDIAKNSTM